MQRLTVCVLGGDARRAIGCMQYWVSIGLLGAVGITAYRLLRREPRKQRWLSPLVTAAILAAGFFLSGAMLRDPAVTEREVEGRPIEVLPEGYVSSRECAACHPAEYASWSASYHRSMTQVATPDTVLGDFDEVELREGSWVFRLSRDGDEYWVDMPMIDRRGRADGPRERRQVVLTTGSHHMQAYWYATGNTRVLGLLPFVFNLELQRWVPRDASFLQPPRDVPSSEVGRWNKTCLQCHVTLGRLRPVEPNGDDTHVAEFGIACESCHGPGAEHAAANRSILRRYGLHFSDDEDPTIVQPERLAHDRASEVCGQCHATPIWTDQPSIDAWMEHGFAYRPGDRLEDTKHIVRGKYEWNPPEVQAVLSITPDFLRDTFWSDGMNRVSGREYNMLLETPCFQRGELSCLSCHQLHRKPDDPRPVEVWADDQLKPGMRGNLACTQCHETYRSDAEVRRHTHHAADSQGSLCYNCHMPYTTYGLLKAIRSHQVSSPSVAVSVETGRPLACNQCHLDRTLAWSAEWLQGWYGIPAPQLEAPQREIAASVLWLLRGDAGQRALAAWSMGWDSALAVSGDDWEALYLGALFGDPYPSVRHMAARALRKLPGFEAAAFDGMAPEERRHEVGNAVINAWLLGREPGATVGRAILIDGRGRPDMARLLGLLRQRDDTPVRFAE